MVSEYPRDLEGFDHYMQEDRRIRAAEDRAVSALAAGMGLEVREVTGVYYVAVPKGTELITAITLERMVIKLRERAERES